MFFSLFSSSLRLENDAHYPLKATIQAANGCLMGELIVSPQEVRIWDDSQGIPKHVQNPGKSITPLTVNWYCMEGTLFSTSDNVCTGALVKAKGGVGNKTCDPKKEEVKK
jgi:hypothetical protein